MKQPMQKEKVIMAELQKFAMAKLKSWKKALKD